MAKTTQAIVIAGAPRQEDATIAQYVQSHGEAFLCCADAGGQLAHKLGLIPDLLVGDFDSGIPVLAKETVTLPPEKDDTDTQYCVKLLCKRGFTDITVLGATGGRLDHTLANISLCEMAYEKGAICRVIDACNIVQLCPAGRQEISVPAGYPYFSLVPLDAKLSGVTIQGAKYEVHNGVLLREQMISISNEPLSDTISIHIDQGRALLIFSKDGK